MAPRYFVLSVDKAFAVLESFNGEHPHLSATEVGRISGLNKATARRLLLTLSDLGYIDVLESGRYRLSPKILRLSRQYLDGLDIPGLALPILQELTRNTGEASNVAVADGKDVVYVARVAVPQRILSTNLDVGSRLPLHATSLGKVLLFGMTSAERRLRLGPPPWPGFTSRTRITCEMLEQDFRAIARSGVSVADRELDEGLCSMAAPIQDHTGRIVAAINLSAHHLTMRAQKLSQTHRNALLKAAQTISRSLGWPPLSKEEGNGKVSS